MGNIEKSYFTFNNITIKFKVLEHSTKQIVIECSCGIVNYKLIRALERKLRVHFKTQCSIMITDVKKSFIGMDYKFTFTGKKTQWCKRCGREYLDCKLYNNKPYCSYCYNEVRHTPKYRCCGHPILHLPLISIYPKYCMYCLDTFHNITRPKAYKAGVIQDMLIRGIESCDNCSNKTDCLKCKENKLCHDYHPKHFLTRENTSGYQIIL